MEMGSEPYFLAQWLVCKWGQSPISFGYGWVCA
ncbi:MAG: hypothetical protein RLZZ227_2181 [Pseudomonadota bacterium]|jgi:hypothetical protein